MKDILQVLIRFKCLMKAALLRDNSRIFYKHPIDTFLRISFGPLPHTISTNRFI